VYNTCKGDSMFLKLLEKLGRKLIAAGYKAMALGLVD
jgi:hypothetical protein